MFFCGSEGKGGRGGGRWGQAKELASQCARVCQNHPLANHPLLSGTEKQPQYRVLGGISCRRQGGYPGGHPHPKNSLPHRSERGNIMFFARMSMTQGADVHDPRGPQKNFMQETFGLILRSVLLFFPRIGCLNMGKARLLTLPYSFAHSQFRCSGALSHCKQGCFSCKQNNSILGPTKTYKLGLS